MSAPVIEEPHHAHLCPYLVTALAAALMTGFFWSFSAVIMDGLRLLPPLALAWLAGAAPAALSRPWVPCSILRSVLA